MKEQILQQVKRAREAATTLALADTAQKNNALERMAVWLEREMEAVVEANTLDMTSGREKGLSAALLDRLMVDQARIRSMAEGIRQLMALHDPVGEGTRMWLGADGIQITQVRTPLGVVGMIYEARPNVTVDAAGLCLKSGNAVVLKGGSEAIHTNTVIAGLLRSAVAEAGLPEESIQFIEHTDRSAAGYLMSLNEWVDVLIPRGGAGLIQTVVDQSRIPVLETGVGNCHLYLDESAEAGMAERILINGKTQRPGVCNALETLLVHRSFAQKNLPGMIKRLIGLGVEVRGCEETCRLSDQAKPASETDWEAEYLDLILAVKVVNSLEEAIAHINQFGTGHSEVIVTENYSHSRQFQQEVDAAVVYVNASSRYTDGFQFGFGAEIGISTQKMHARGPMGLEALTSIKYQVLGAGQVRK